MAKPELGMKRVCVSCNTKFYDLTRQPAVCPKCGTEQPSEQPRMRRPAGNVADDKRRAKVIPVPGVEEPDTEVEVVEEEAEEEDVLEDTSDLGEEEAEIVEVEQEGGEEER